jgi:microcin C transport system permease protein
LAFYSFILLSFVFAASLASEWIANDKPYVMKYQGQVYFPIFKAPTGPALGIADAFTVDYRKLDLSGENWALFPPIRFNPYESNNAVETFPSPPSKVNPLGTDDRGRDVFTRLLYGFRISFFYAMGVWILWDSA